MLAKSHFCFKEFLVPKKQDHQKQHSLPNGRRRSRLGREFFTSFGISFPIQYKPSPLNTIYNGSLA